MPNFFLQATNYKGWWLNIQSGGYCILTDNINTRLQMSYWDQGGLLFAPGWQWGNPSYQYVLDQSDVYAFFWAYIFGREGVKLTLLPDGQICRADNNNARLCRRGTAGPDWVIFSSTDHDPDTVYLQWKKVFLTAEEERTLAANHPSARAPGLIKAAAV
jgi:hypothetical protein